MAEPGGHPPQPPASRWAAWLTQVVGEPHLASALLGDLAEEYVVLATRVGARRATLWYWWQVVRALPSLWLVRRRARQVVRRERQQPDRMAYEPVPRWYLGLLGVVLCLVLGGCLGTAALADARLMGRLTPALPIPPGATQVRQEYLRAVPSDSEYRQTRFRAAHSRAALRAFYRHHLAQRGWSYVGTPTPACDPEGGSQVVDVYVNAAAGILAAPTIELNIARAGAAGEQAVSLNEYRSRTTFQSRPTPAPDASVATALLGNWQSAPSSPIPVMLCFYEHGRVLVTTARLAMSGTYRVADEQADNVTLATEASTTTVGASAQQAPSACGTLPRLLRSACTSQVLGPRAYPPPDGGAAPTSTDARTAAGYPAPAPLSTTVVRIAGTYEVALATGQLVLRSDTGPPLVLERQTGDDGE